MIPRSLALALPLAIVACATGQVTQFSMQQTPPPPSTPGGFMQGSTITLTIEGTGKCARIDADFGDGTVEQLTSVDFGDTAPFQTVEATHVYPLTGWPGFKRVTVTGVTNCAGQSQQVVSIRRPGSGNVGSVPVTITPGTIACMPLFANRQPIRAGTRIFVNQVRPPSGNPPKIDFGCAAGGCVYDIEGEPNSTADSSYPLSGARKYTLLARVGGQISQDLSSSRPFVVVPAQGLPSTLELCLNDNDLAGNSGSWAVDLNVDEEDAR